MTSIWDQSVSSHRQQARDHIVHAALDLISEKGVSEISMSELAKAAGVSRKTLYSYFSDLSEVIVAWMEAEIEREHHLLEGGISALDDPIEKLSFYVRNSLRMCAERHHHSGVEAAMSSEAAIGHENWGQISQAFTRTEDLVKEILTEGVEQRKLRPDLDIDIQARVIFYLPTSLHHVVSGSESDPDSMADAMMDLILNGIGAK